MTPEEIRQAYRDPAKGLIGVSAFAKKIGVPVTEAKEALRGEDVYSLNKPAPPRNFPRRKIMVNGPYEQLQIDLADLNNEKPENDGYRYIFVAIDCFSRYVWAVPTKTKSAAEVTHAMTEVLDDIPIGRGYKKVQSDQGKEFFNAVFDGLMEKLDITHFFTRSEIKCAIAERFIRTLRGRLTRLWTAQGNVKWVEALPALIESYNNTYHSSIKMTPAEAMKPENTAQVYTTLYHPIEPLIVPQQPDFGVGDSVRILRERGPFTKKSLFDPWSREVFTVSGINWTTPITFHIDDHKGDRIEGVWYAQELQKVDKPDAFGIDILGERRRRGRKEVLVKWLGYDTEPEWIPESRLVS